jgi:hypothetical protein
MFPHQSWCDELCIIVEEWSLNGYEVQVRILGPQGRKADWPPAAMRA